VTVFRGRLAAFIAIPESDEYHEVSSLISLSLEEHNVQEIRSPCVFTSFLLEACKRADVVIADITETNPSTYYVIGVSQASQKPVLLLSKENSAAPLEISGFKVLQYKPGNVRRMSELLHSWLSDIVAEVSVQKAGQATEADDG
jgi:nucleoside 2-deoxyribosyltransferase